MSRTVYSMIPPKPRPQQTCRRASPRSKKPTVLDVQKAPQEVCITGCMCLGCLCNWLSVLGLNVKRVVCAWAGCKTGCLCLRWVYITACMRLGRIYNRLPVLGWGRVYIACCMRWAVCITGCPCLGCLYNWLPVLGWIACITGCCGCTGSASTGNQLYTQPKHRQPVIQAIQDPSTRYHVYNWLPVLALPV